MSNEPTLVVLGASGDLAARLLFPALLSLERRERLEGLRIIGYARQEWTTEQFHENLRASGGGVFENGPHKHVGEFLLRRREGQRFHVRPTRPLYPRAHELRRVWSAGRN